MGVGLFRADPSVNTTTVLWLVSSSASESSSLARLIWWGVRSLLLPRPVHGLLSSVSVGNKRLSVVNRSCGSTLSTSTLNLDACLVTVTMYCSGNFLELLINVWSTLREVTNWRSALSSGFLIIFMYSIIRTSSRRSLISGVCVTTSSAEVGVPTMAFVTLCRACWWTCSILALVSNGAWHQTG